MLSIFVKVGIEYFSAKVFIASGSVSQAPTISIPFNLFIAITCLCETAPQPTNAIEIFPCFEFSKITPPQPLLIALLITSTT